MRWPLHLHPDSVCEAVSAIEVEAVLSAPDRLSLQFLVTGTMSGLRLPDVTRPMRADGLWQHTCFEAFVRGPGDAYYEFNLSPSTEWAAYAFDGYRSGMRNLDMTPPVIGLEPDGLRAELELPREAPWLLGLSAVIEETSGRKSYWALAHPAGKADFHDPNSFRCELS